ncbi:hypothetical protein AB5J72_43490 [Streptomyces sp. CG1]|uniref:hypothetical protein n=1 Tax=Streptomyces sp. CG1 TaxID=1287523 RepID=UPI0034E2FE75
MAMTSDHPPTTGDRPPTGGRPPRYGHGADRRLPGPETLGDPVFPALGNDGHRVSSYHLDLAYDPTTKLVESTDTLRIRTTGALNLPQPSAGGTPTASTRSAWRYAPCPSAAARPGCAR